jgi:hypothetical protein
MRRSTYIEPPITIVESAQTPPIYTHLTLIRGNDWACFEKTENERVALD